MVRAEHVISWMKALRQVFRANKEYLTQLDAAIGDADHGINLDRGFNAVWDELEKTRPGEISSILKAAAMTLIKTVGGASGPLYGTFFLRASSACADKTELGAAALVAIWAAGLEGVRQRGKAALNDKTMVDALTPAVTAMQQALENGGDLGAILAQGAAAAEAGMQNTIPLQARKGRASYLGPRSIGHQDPGATSSYLLIQTAANVWGKERSA
ncbi:MAG: dihydroxyacetone kinase subunit L [Desulfobacterales bacterium]|nr:MAG: dihydroxyacetone kinase subunit L [Desulfobacterales bacterium]